MAASTLFDLACEMLRETNPFNRNVNELKCKIDDDELSLIDMVEYRITITMLIWPE